MTERSLAPLVLASVLFVAIVAAGVGPANAADQRGDRGKRPRAKGPAIGAKAPDFALPRLEQEVGAEGETVSRVSEGRIRLSSFRGKRVVCLFMSSYT